MVHTSPRRDGIFHMSPTGKSISTRNCTIVSRTLRNKTYLCELIRWRNACVKNVGIVEEIKGLVRET